ncbi:MAG: hypothetical protein RLZZ600_1307, partial [Actinomycetota bacterium]
PALLPTPAGETDILTVDKMQEILEAAIEGMARGVYSTAVYTREVAGDYNSGWTNRIHTIRAVSS